MNILASYNRLLSKYPIGANCLSAGVMYVLCVFSHFCRALVGDYGAQMLEQYQKKKNGEIKKICWRPNLKRSRNLFGWGFLFTGLPVMGWFGLMGKIKFFNKFAKIPNDILKTVATNSFYSPMMTVAFFAYIMGLENFKEGWGSVKENTVKKIKDEFMGAFILSLKIWIPGNFLAFAVIPDLWKVVFVNGVAAVWNMYLSIAGYRKKDEAEDIKLEEV